MLVGERLIYSALYNMIRAMCFMGCACALAGTRRATELRESKETAWHRQSHSRAEKQAREVMLELNFILRYVLKSTAELDYPAEHPNN